MKLIRLSKGKIAKVDDEDYEWLMQWKWSFDGKYAQRYFCETKNMKMHRQIMDAKDGEQVDHINQDKLDNRRANLRLCTDTENKRNSPLRKDNTSGYKGVYFEKSKRKWHTHIAINGKIIYLGLYETAEEGARVYDDAARKYFGEFASPNFRDTP